MNSSRPPLVSPSPTGGTGDKEQLSEWARFGARVRQLRTQAGLSPRDLALGEVCSVPMLRAIEAGDTDLMRPTVEYLDSRLEAGGRLLDAWARALISTHLAEGTPVERWQRGAEQIREFQPGMIPEFFHTDAYARALARAARPLRASVPGAEVDRARLVRRSPVADTGPPYFGLILDEAALRTVVGDVETTREQIRHLLRFLERDHVSMQLIPARTRNHPCRGGPFRVLSFSPHHQLAYVPTPCGPGHLVTAPSQVSAYADLFAALSGAALCPDDSLELLRAILADLAEPTASVPKAITAGPERGSTVPSPVGTARTSGGPYPAG